MTDAEIAVCPLGHTQVDRPLTERQDSRETDNMLLSWAASGMLDVSEFFDLVGTGVDVNCRDSNGQTPLMLATAAGFVHTSRFLVELGADLHASDAHGRTPLNLANSATAAEITAAAEALELRRLAEGSLLEAAACGNTDAVTAQIQLGVDTDCRDSRGRTPLMRAAMLSHSGTVKALLDLGADPLIRDSAGMDACALVRLSRYGMSDP
ncbi:g520 [Coccomyxa elongata]